MNQLFYGSICLTDLIEKAKQKHSAFSKAQNGKIYVNVNIWLNETPDKYGNLMSVKVNPSKAMKDLEEGFYIGNLKKSDGPVPVSDRDINGLDTEFDVPVYEKAAPNAVNPTDDTDLPF